MPRRADCLFLTSLGAIQRVGNSSTKGLSRQGASELGVDAGGRFGDNRKTMLRLTAIPASVSLLLTSFAALFFHLHEANQHQHDTTDIHRHSAEIHSHLTIHIASSANHQPTIGSTHGDTGVSQVSLYVFEQKTSFLMPFLPGRGFVSEKLSEFSACPPVPEPQAHDPPLISPYDGRAPPA